MILSRIDIWSYQPLMRDGPYAMSHVVQDRIYGRVLRLTTDNGLTGWGEIVHAPSVPVEGRQAMVDAEGDLFAKFVGHPLGVLADYVGGARSRDKPYRGVAFGLETAMLDLQAKAAGLPLYAVLGGRKAESVADYFSIAESTEDRLRHRMSVAGPDRSVIQLKLGVGSLDDDRAKLRLVLSLMNAGQTLLADANGGWTVDQALEMAAEFVDPRLWWEEPCATYDDNIAVAKGTATPVMVDQSTASYDIAIRAIDDGIAAAICIKPAFLGGLQVAREIRDLAAEKGMRMRIDGPWCGGIATGAILHLALGTPPDLLICGCDLREPLALDPNLGGAVHIERDRIAPPIGAGVGLTIGDNFGAPEGTYAAPTVS
ncbi:MAG: mandelate racemase/muconate lactonizing enzyme family protein [Alphaproteobacteria bacterium]